LCLSTKSAVKNPKNFEHWFSQRLWVKFAMFLLNSTSVDAGAIIGGYHWGIDFYTFAFVLVDKLYSSFIT